MTSRFSISGDLAKGLIAARTHRGWSQRDLGDRLGKPQTRIAELERSLASSKPVRDRLHLFVEACDALGIVPVLVPLGRVAEVHRFLGEGADDGARFVSNERLPDLIDEVFVDLSVPGEEE